MICGICDKGPDEHEGMNHQFSEEGKLIPLEPKPKKPPAGKVDFPLRLLLIGKGIITEAELKTMEEAVRDELRRDADSALDRGAGD